MKKDIEYGTKSEDILFISASVLNGFLRKILNLVIEKKASGKVSQPYI